MREIKFRGQTYDTPPHWVFGHVRELRNGTDMELIDEAKRQTMRAYDRCTFLYEVLK